MLILSFFAHYVWFSFFLCGINHKSAVLVSWKSFRNNLKILCHPLCNQLYISIGILFWRSLRMELSSAHLQFRCWEFSFFEYFGYFETFCSFCLLFLPSFWGTWHPGKTKDSRKSWRTTIKRKKEKYLSTSHVIKGRKISVFVIKNVCLKAKSFLHICMQFWNFYILNFLFKRTKAQKLGQPKLGSQWERVKSCLYWTYTISLGFMYLYICMYVYIYTCVYISNTFLHMHMYSYMYVFAYVRMYICRFWRVYVYAYAYVWVCMHVVCVGACIDICIYVCMYIYVFIRVERQTSMYACKYSFFVIYIYVHVYTYIYICIYM